jgi:hypothetical protein
VLEGQPKLAQSALEQKFAKEVETSDEVELGLTPDALDRITVMDQELVGMVTGEGFPKLL